MEECDRCAPPKPAVYLLIKGDNLLTFCRACAQELYPYLSTKGWEFTPLTSTVGVPQHTPNQVGRYWIDMPDDLPVDMSRLAS